MKTLTIITMAIVLAVCAGAHANEAKDLDRAAARINAHSNTLEGATKVLTKISDETGVPVATLQTQRF